MRTHLPWEWEVIESGFNDFVTTWRAKVIGGWIVKEEYYCKEDEVTPIYCSIIFIADPDHQWTIITEAEIREAEKSNACPAAILESTGHKF